MKVIFLDYDGVVNTPIWENGECGYNFPHHGKVNNYQAICWLNELCKKTGAKIVVSSTWRYTCHEVSYKDCLYNAGLNQNIEIIGHTSYLESYESRTKEIKAYLKEHSEIEAYVILDDELILDSHFVKCNANYGFGIEEFHKALEMLKKIRKRKENEKYNIR